jgi:hypothetical protein
VGREPATLSKPARREIRSALSASSVLAEEFPPLPPWPIDPSLIATTDNAERDVVVELGVPGPNSLGVAGSEGGGGTVEGTKVNESTLNRYVTHTVDQGRPSIGHFGGIETVSYWREGGI